MAALIPKDGTLLNYADQAPSPQKDYCQILVKKDKDTKKGKVVFRLWKITLRQNAKSYPVEVLDTYEDFEHDDRIHSEIHRVFGKNMLDYVTNLVHGHIDYLPRLPRPILIQIIRNLDLQDVTMLSLTSKMFRELCDSNDLWEAIYHDHSETPITDDLRCLAEGLGWKRLFFTNKLQLQVQLRRAAKQREMEQAFMTQKLDD